MLALLEHPRPAEALTVLCETSVEELDVTAAAVAAVIGDEPLGVLASAGTGMDAVADQLASSAGPAWDAHHEGRVVSVPDLGLGSPWPELAEDAMAAGIQALFSFPLSLGSARFGALVLGRDRPGPADPADVADAIVLADVAALLVLSAHAGAGGAAVGDPIVEATELRAVVHQAAGMVSVQMGVDIADAHVALRARAWVLGQSVADVAKAVVSRRLRFGDE